MTSTTPFDWDAPLNADGPSRSAALRAALGVTTPQLSRFIGELHRGISCAAWGFPQLGDLADVEQRALVSDQLLGCRSSIGFVSDCR